MRRLVKQLFRFSAAGMLCFAIDYAMLILLTEKFGINYLLSSGISYTVSIIVNYILSVRFIFNIEQDSSKKTRFLIFAALSIIGLLLTQAIMWYMVNEKGLFYMISKIGATLIVTVYNYISRKTFLENSSLEFIKGKIESERIKYLKFVKEKKIIKEL